MAIPASTSLLIARELTSMTVTKLGIAAMASAVLAAIGGGVYQFGGANAGQAPVARQAAAGQVTSEPKPEAKRPGDDWKRHERNLKRIGLALHNYHDAHGGFPTAAIMGRDGTPLLSWRVAILPYLSHADGAGDFGDLHRQFHLDEPWDSPHNRTLLAKMPDAFEAPGGKLGSFETPYRALTGPKTMFEGNRGITLRDVPDGPEKTLMVVEDRQAVPWTKTDEMSRATLLQRLGEINGEVFAALFASGHVRQLEYIGGGHSMGCRLAMEESRSLWIFSGRMSCLQMPGGGWGFPMTGLVEEAKVRTIRKRKI